MLPIKQIIFPSSLQFPSTIGKFSISYTTECGTDKQADNITKQKTEHKEDSSKKSLNLYKLSRK